jgi:hypothetical protein
VRDDLRLQIAYSEIEDLPRLERQVRARLRWVAERSVELRDIGHLGTLRRLDKPWRTTRLLIVRAIQLAVLDGLARGLRRAHAEIVDAMESTTDTARGD